MHLKEKVSVLSVGKLNRHFMVHYQGFDEEFKDLRFTNRNPVQQMLKRSLSRPRSSVKKFVCRPRATTAASFAVSHVATKPKKPFSEGEIVKNAFLDAAEFLFAEIINKDGMLPAITDLQLS